MVIAKINEMKLAKKTIRVFAETRNLTMLNQKSTYSIGHEKWNITSSYETLN